MSAARDCSPSEPRTSLALPAEFTLTAQARGLMQIVFNLKFFLRLDQVAGGGERYKCGRLIGWFGDSARKTKQMGQQGQSRQRAAAYATGARSTPLTAAGRRVHLHPPLPLNCETVAQWCEKRCDQLEELGAVCAAGRDNSNGKPASLCDVVSGQ